MSLRFPSGSANATNIHVCMSVLLFRSLSCTLFLEVEPLGASAGRRGVCPPWYQGVLCWSQNLKGSIFISLTWCVDTCSCL